MMTAMDVLPKDFFGLGFGFNIGNPIACRPLHFNGTARHNHGGGKQGNQ